MPKPVFPLSIRRKALRLYSDGHSSTKISAMLGASPHAIRKWVQDAKVPSKSNLSEEELDAKIEAWGLDVQKYGDAQIAENAAESTKRRRTGRASHRAKYGSSPLEKANAVKSFEELGDPQVYQDAIKEHFGQVTEQLSHDNTLAEQVKSLSAGLLLVQLKAMIDNPPPVTSWSDGEKVIKLLRLTLNMDAQKTDERPRIDLTIINGKTGKKRQERVINVPAKEVISIPEPDPSFT